MRMALTLLSDVTSQAKSVLARSRIFDLRKLCVESDGDCLVLRGKVDSFYHKQLAQELVRSAVEGTEVVNAINVVYGRERLPDDLDGRW
jgi:hypothetical protein